MWNLVTTATYLKNRNRRKTSFPSLGPFLYHTNILCNLLILTITLCYYVIPPTILILFLQKELKSVETVRKALHQLRRIIFSTYYRIPKPRLIFSLSNNPMRARIQSSENSPRMTKAFDKVLRLEKDGYHRLTKPLISGGVKILNNSQPCKLQINITLNSKKTQRCVVQ